MRFRGLEPQPCLNHKSSPRVRKGEKEDTDFRLLSKRSGGARRAGGFGGVNDGAVSEQMSQIGNE